MRDVVDAKNAENGVGLQTSALTYVPVHNLHVSSFYGCSACSRERNYDVIMLVFFFLFLWSD
jgi:hypothetical protein